MPLEELSTFVAQCLAHYKTPPGQRLVVHQWNYTAGNQPDPQHPTLRAALDAVSTKVEIQLLGNDAHHGAFNSLALAHATRIRAHYAQNPLIQANYIKLFADGVLEGDPYSVPPTLPNAAALKPFLQPIFAVDAQGHATVTGYVDTASPTCVDVRAHPDKYASDTAVSSFMKTRGYHPAQCQISSGQLQHSREIILEYIKRMHVAGFNIHIHAIGDRSVRTAIDAIEAARAADGISTTRDSLAAGSDAPVDTPDPRPFINMSYAITRASRGAPALSPQQSITIHDAIEAYTINGARMLSRDKDTGSLEVGKSADFVILDRNIVTLGDSGHAADIAGTRVLATWFQGKKVYAAE